MDKTKFALLGIFILAVILRFSFLSVSPPALNWDEASLGYNAYSILQTGKDEWGRFLPLTFEAFGDYKLPVYVYSAVPFIGLFGLNDEAVRLPSILSGIFAPILLFLIVKNLTKNNNLALIPALLLTISPWHIFLSRAALEANLALTIFLIGFYIFLIGLKKPYFLIPSAVFLGLTVFTYNSARIFVPLFILSLMFTYKRKLLSLKKHLVLPGLILFILIGLAGYLAIFEDSSSRYFWVTIIDEGAINFLDQSRNHSTLPDLLTKIVYNRYSYFSFEFIKNYFSHFSPSYLFFQGGSNYQFSTPSFGIMYLIELPFLLIGGYQAFRKKSLNQIFLIWVLLAPIPSAITREAPHVLRSIFMLGGLQALVALGLWQSYSLIKNYSNGIKRLSIGLITLIFLIQSALYLNNYFFVYPKNYSESWQYGYKQALDYVLSNPELSSKPLYISKRYGEPHIFYLFYTKYDPLKYQTNPTLVRYARTNWRWVDRLDNVYFINDWEVKEKLKDQHGVLITAPDNYPGNPPILKQFKFLDGKGAFDVVEI